MRDERGLAAFNAELHGVLVEIGFHIEDFVQLHRVDPVTGQATFRF